ncbi:MAG: hypothetical protein FWE82_03635 [Defluviitaleaceae bacterium]|nr:hypothetical protein [Defluviitaleaceae bacterium]
MEQQYTNETDGSQAAANPEIGLNVKYLLQQIEKIQADQQHIHDTLQQIGKIVTHEPSLNADDTSGAAKAQAVNDVVRAREETNRQMLSLYEKMYDDIKPPKPASYAETEKFKMISNFINNPNNNDTINDYIGDAFNEILKKTFD